MNLQKWALIGEISGAVAVVVSLVFVGYQLKQSNEQATLNTRALEQAAYQQLIEGISDFNVLTIENTNLRIARKKLDAGEQLDSDEKDVINAFLYLAYRNGDLAYLQYEKGFIDEERLRSGLGLLVNLLALPSVQAHWNQARSGFTESYQTFINKLIEEADQGDSAVFSEASNAQDLMLEVENVERMWLSAIAEGDRTSYDNLLTEDFTWTFVSGRVIDREQTIKAIGPVAITESDKLIRVHQDSAVVIGIASLEVQGRPLTERFVRVWIRDPNGQWKLANFQATEII